MIIHDVADYIQQEVSLPPFYLQHLLPMGGTLLLSGKPGAMKSWLVEHIAFCITTGTPWLDFETVQASCFLINFEISPALYHKRLRDMARNFSLENLLLYESSPSYMFLEETAAFNRFKEDVDQLDPKIVILDCLSGCFGGDENSPVEMARFILKIDSMKRDGRSIIIVQHTNKNPLITSPMDKVRGHTKLPAYVDTVIFLTEQPTGRQLQFGKTRLSTIGQIHSRNIIFEDYLWRLR